MFGLGAERPRPPDPGPRALLPPGRAPRPPRHAWTATCARRRSRRFSWRAGDAERIFDVRLTPLARRRRARWARASRTSTSPRPTGCRSKLAGSQARARAGLRGAAVDGRGARDDQRGAPVDQRGARDDERGAPVDQRGARDDERGAPVDQRGARDDERGAPAPDAGGQRRQRVPGDDPEHDRVGGRGARSQPARPDLERRGP